MSNDVGIEVVTRNGIVKKSSMERLCDQWQIAKNETGSLSTK